MSVIVNTVTVSLSQQPDYDELYDLLVEMREHEFHPFDTRRTVDADNRLLWYSTILDNENHASHMFLQGTANIVVIQLKQGSTKSVERLVAYIKEYWDGNAEVTETDGIQLSEELTH